MAKFPFIRQAALIAMTLSLGLQGAAQPARAEVLRAPTATTKFLVEPNSPANKFVRTNGTLIADYGSFSVWQVADSNVNSLNKLAGAQAADLDTIGLRGISFNPLKNVPTVQSSLSQSPTADPQLWLVQFAGPLKDAWLDEITKAGAERVIYMPNNAYLVWANGQTLAKLDSLSKSNVAIQWAGAYHPEYRLAPELRQKASNPDAKGLVDVTIQFYNSATVAQDVNEVLKASAQVYATPWQVLNFTTISVQVSEDALGPIARRANVYNVESWQAPKLMDERQGQILAGNITTAGGKVVPNGPGYLQWLQSQGVPTDPNQYPIVDIVDDGLDNGTTSPIHPDFYVNGVKPGTSRIAAVGNCTADATGANQDGHGHLNVGIVGSYNNLTGSPHVDGASSGIAGGYRVGLGISPFGRMASTKIFNNAGSFNLTNCGGGSNYFGIIEMAYSHGAAISSNSWGADSGGAYTASSQAFDQGTRDASSTTAGNQEMTHIIAAGNAGRGGANTVGAPGTAKNVITVGATENVRDQGVIDGCNEPNADNADDIALFSSLGPTDDARVKPDIMAPGTHVMGPASQQADFSGDSVCAIAGSAYYPTGQTLYTWSSGTSHSTPAVAGSASLLYTKYRTSFGGGVAPSPAMLKAYLLASTRYLNGTGTGGTLPSNQQGWGDVNLAPALDSTQRILVDQTRTFGATGEEFTQVGQIAESTKPVRITLAWTDAAGSTTGNSYVNNLDLEVTAGGQTYKGNVFNGALSTTGGTADTKNNIEGVYLPAGTTGTIQVKVIARNIAGDAIPGNADTTDQDFALYVYNGSVGPTGTLTGRVAQSNNNPVAGATVRTSGGASALTNASGNYSMVVPVGTYAVTASLQGAFQAVPSVTITQNVTTTQNFTLSYGSISGTVRDAFTPSNAVAGATVSVPGYTTTTNAAGQYTIPVANVGSTTVTVSAPKYVTQSQTVTVADATNATQDFTLAAGAVAGIVTNSANGAPVADATVAISNQYVKTKADGSFAIRLEPGSYTLTASKIGFAADSESLTISNGVTATQNLAITPAFGYTPASLSRTFTFGDAPFTDTVGLTLTNNGTQPFTYTIRENGQAGFTPAAVQAGKVLVVQRNSATSATAATTALTALGYTFESIDNVAFEARSLANLQTFDAVIYLGATGGTGSSPNPSENKLTEYLNAGGRLFIADNDLGFFTNPGVFYKTMLDSTYGGDDPGAANRALTGADFMAGVNAASSDSFPDYYTPGSSSTVIFRYVNNAVGGSFIQRNSYKAVYLATDFVNLGTSTGGETIERTVLERVLQAITGGSDSLPWLKEAPTTGVIPGGATRNVAIGWNPSAVTQPGTYTGSLSLGYSAVITQTFNIPVTMVVNPSATQARISGTVTSSGICDTVPAPASGAKILITYTNGVTATVTTNAAGQYAFFVPQGGTYTVAASAVDHLGQSQSVTVTDGGDVTQNFTLRLNKPCVTVSPSSLSASLVLGAAPVTQTLVVTSKGAAPLNATISEQSRSAVSQAGYTIAEVPYSWIEANDGTDLALTDDGAANITSPFTVTIFNTSSRNLRVGNNGGILVGATTGDVAASNASLLTGTVNNIIAPFWDDIDDGAGGVFWKVIGTAPNRSLIVQWNNRAHYENIGSGTFQVVIKEQGGMVYQYKDVDYGDAAFNNGASATVGVRGATTAQAVQYSFNQPRVRNEMALCVSATCDGISWLSESPTTITGLAGTPPSNQVVNVVFSTAGVTQAGVYTGNLILTHNSPQPAVTIPVTLTVTAPANFGTVSGTVQGLAACDVSPAPLSGATVTINTATPTVLTTDAAGAYSYSLAAGTYTVTIAKAGYVTQTFTVVVPASGAVTQNAELRLNAPCLDVDTTPISETVGINTITTQTLTLENNGAAPLTWTIGELAANGRPAPTSGNGEVATRKPVPASNRLNGNKQTAPAAEVIQDGSFEATESDGSNPFWTQTSTNFSDIVMCTADCDEDSISDVPHTGEFYVWFGGINATMPTEEASLEQTFTASSDSEGTLSFWMFITAAANRPNDYMRVLIDGNEVYRVTNPERTGFPTYTLVEVPIDSADFDAGTTHTLRVEAVIQSGGNSNFFLDDISLDLGVACSPDAASWVRAVPNSGTIAADGSANVALEFNTNGLAAGLHTVNLCIQSNDTTKPNVQIPVTINVSENVDPTRKVYLPWVNKN
ncbi:carboxypeptidase regulatory-like domain-containing protein [Herpetosiphon sp. NSE202]|uniref:carboxypeptidase regulatory-like domain-containing protein n=1 Tax=Herpetosiphon sp. NSE202 TaxID=3351349 RepID=UPI0036458C57